MIHKKNRNETRMSRQAEKVELGDRLCDLGIDKFINENKQQK